MLTVARPEGTVAVRLTEVEAYSGTGDDPGSHTHRGRTARNAAMFGAPPRLYVYLSYGIHYCGNIVCAPEGTGSGVLMRGGEIVEGLELARERRPACRRDAELARGPGRLGQALGLRAADDDTPIALAGEPEGGMLSLELPATPVTAARGPRTGVSGPAGTDAFPWRFWIEGNPTVSPYRASVTRRR